MFAKKTNVIVLTVEIITLKLCKFCAQNAQIEAHTETNYTTTDTRFILHIFTHLHNTCHPVTKMEKLLKGFQLLKQHCMANFSSIFRVSIWEVPLNAINSCYIKVDDFMDIFESQSN